LEDAPGNAHYAIMLAYVDAELDKGALGISNVRQGGSGKTCTS
jgi:hypothetical protein